MPLIDLYEPAPGVPEKVIGKAEISRGLSEKVYGLMHDRRLEEFQLRLIEPTPPTPAANVDRNATILMETIACRVVRLWKDGQSTWTWRAVVPSEIDREKVASKPGLWIG